MKITKDNVIMTLCAICFCIGWVLLMSCGPEGEPTLANLAGLVMLASVGLYADSTERKGLLKFSPEDDEV